MKHLTQLLTILVGSVLISSTASAQLTVTGGGLFVPDGDLNVPNNHVTMGPAGSPNLKIYNDGEMAWNSPGQVDWTLRPNGANMFRIGTSGSPAGANTFVINSVGQIGLGGTPSTQFDVKGPMRLYGSLGGAEMVFDPQTASAWTIRGGEGGLFRIGSTESGANLLVLNNAGRVGIGTTNPGAKLEVAGQVKITGGSPGAGKVLTSDGEGLASWETASDGAQGPQGEQGPAGAQGAQGKQGPPGQDSGTDCVECSELQQIIFDAVCKIFDGAITNTSEVSECIGVIGQLALVGVDVCSPNEDTCLSIILGNVQDLLDSK